MCLSLHAAEEFWVVEHDTFFVDRKLRAEPVTDEELRRAQEYAIGTYAIRQQSGGAVLGDIVDAWLHGSGLAELGEYEARVRSLTPADLQKVAEQYFDEGVRVEGIVRGR